MRNNLLILSILVTWITTAQVKVEREFCIDLTAVPTKAQQFIKDLNITQNVRWIKEIDSDASSIEAKFKGNGRRYSIEFSPEGKLEDLEVVINFSQIPLPIRKNIEQLLERTFDYYKIEKTQEQYQENTNLLKSWYHTSIDKQTLQPHYEIVVKTRMSKEKSKRYEFLFNEQGGFVKKERISVRSDNVLRF